MRTSPESSALVMKSKQNDLVSFESNITFFFSFFKFYFQGVYVPVSRYYKWITQTIAHQEIPKYSKHNSCKDALCFY